MRRLGLGTCGSSCADGLAPGTALALILILVLLRLDIVLLLFPVYTSSNRASVSPIRTVHPREAQTASQSLVYLSITPKRSRCIDLCRPRPRPWPVAHQAGRQRERRRQRH